ncbi:hypothetical protein QBC47DRAFT_358513 [Echria macrotheca]|uniref:Uncharacterized protein n=1 Tax=Echria macrotheca TaxID=438768 RepID=A0AAJ0BML0_9PEZI|nr:hypothetical protein QBC47DRAFT_358513 [Echria macrotheca]
MRRVEGRTHLSCDHGRFGLQARRRNWSAVGRHQRDGIGEQRRNRVGGPVGCEAWAVASPSLDPICGDGGDGTFNAAGHRQADRGGDEYATVEGESWAALEGVQHGDGVEGGIDIAKEQGATKPGAGIKGRDGMRNAASELADHCQLQQRQLLLALDRHTPPASFPASSRPAARKLPAPACRRQISPPWTSTPPAGALHKRASGRAAVQIIMQESPSDALWLPVSSQFADAEPILVLYFGGLSDGPTLLRIYYAFDLDLPIPDQNSLTTRLPSGLDGSRLETLRSKHKHLEAGSGADITPLRAQTVSIGGSGQKPARCRRLR